jgi:tRNA A-37 threonylcarbamoyl transferase component Bud32
MSADTEIAVKCQTLTREPAIAILVTWAIVVLPVLTYSFYAMANYFNRVPSDEAGLRLLIGGAVLLLTLALVLFFGYVPFVIATAVTEGGRLFLSEEGIGLPPGLLGFGKPRWFCWNDLRGVDIKLQGGELNGSVVLNFKGGRYKINTATLSASDLERVLLGIEVWAKSATWTSDAATFRDLLQDRNRGISRLSYTEIWQNELGRHFNSTTFVPLAPETVLEGRAIKILRQIAFGGFSAIYLAEFDQKNVVLKESVAPADATEELKNKANELFHREAALLSSLNHPNIAKVIDSFVENGRNYLILEFIHGPNLRQLVKTRGALPEDTVRLMALQMAEMLRYLHAQSPPIVHRDFTPDNIVMRDDGQLILIDFGAANQFIGTATGTLVGKQCYMPPEQIKGKASPSSDVYSMGATLHFLLTGRDPEALTSSDPSRDNPAVSSGFSEVIRSATSLSSGERPSANQVLELIRTELA